MELEEIFNTYYDRVYSFTLLRVGTAHDAENIASDVFLRVVEKLAQYDPQRAAFSTWLFTIALNEIRMYFRGRKTVYSLESVYEVADRLDIEEELLRQEERAALYRAISGLDERQKDIVLLKYNGGLTSRQIGEILGLSETNVETILSRAKKILKKTLDDCEELPPGAYKNTKAEEVAAK